MVLRDINKAKRILYNRQALYKTKLTRKLIFSTGMLYPQNQHIVVKSKTDYYI